MAPCSSSFASLNLSAESFPAGQFYRDTHICSVQAAAAWWCSLLSVRSVTGSKSLTSPLLQLMPWGEATPPPPAQLQSLWQAAEAGMNLPLITQTWIIKRLPQSPGLQKMSSLAKAGEGFGWKMTYSRYREQSALSLCARSDLWCLSSWSDRERCCGWMAGLLINHLSLNLHLQDPPPSSAQLNWGLTFILTVRNERGSVPKLSVLPM